jgi:elongation factor 1-alpha
MISGAAQADVCLLMVPADGNFTTAIQKGDHKAGEIQGQTRQHARLLNLLGVKQLIVGINKMDSDTAGYKQVGAGCALRAAARVGMCIWRWVLQSLHL